MLESGKISSEIEHFYASETLQIIRGECDHKFDRKITAGKFV